MKVEWKIEIATDGYVDTKLTTDDEAIARDFLGRHTPMPYSEIHGAIERQERIQFFPYEAKGSDVVLKITRKNLR